MTEKTKGEWREINGRRVWYVTILPPKSEG